MFVGSRQRCKAPQTRSCRHCEASASIREHQSVRRPHRQQTSPFAGSSPRSVLLPGRRDARAEARGGSQSDPPSLCSFGPTGGRGVRGRRRRGGGGAWLLASGSFQVKVFSGVKTPRLPLIIKCEAWGRREGAGWRGEAAHRGERLSALLASTPRPPCPQRRPCDRAHAACHVMRHTPSNAGCTAE